MRILVILSVLGLGLAAFTLAEDEGAGGAELSKVTLGEHWYGPKVELEELKGKVVLLEFWGFN